MFRLGWIPKHNDLPTDAPRQRKLFAPRWITFMASDGSVLEVDEREFDLALEQDPGLRTLPPADPNQFVLTPEDRVLLWSVKIGTDDRSTDERSGLTQWILNVLTRPT